MPPSKSLEFIGFRKIDSDTVRHFSASMFMIVRVLRRIVDFELFSNDNSKNSRVFYVSRLARGALGTAGAREKARPGLEF